MMEGNEMMNCQKIIGGGYFPVSDLAERRQAL